MSKKKLKTIVKLKRVTRKYACSSGIIIDHVKLYTNGKLKYPYLEYDKQNPFRNDVELSLDPNSGGDEIDGFIIHAHDKFGKYRETITCTEGMII
jgi:hypothetical protein